MKESPTTRRLLLLSPVALTLFGLIAIPLAIMGYISLLPRNLYGGAHLPATADPDRRISS